MKKFLLSFTYALKGLSYAFQTQFNFKVHTVSTLIAVLMGFYYNISKQEWLWVIVAIGLVLVTELLNTALEVLVDFVSPGFHPKAGIIKDVSAGAVLVMAFLAISIGLIIFVPRMF